ncbi:DUF4351 domain-containing protein [Chondromyces apiculatus]|uniref:DUF4351 domain-containing protein n=1 Tax=Chondromyces apiculatus DSM 436 TaxID=1192034 RepID=A0A017T181_9BACT|nr:DUF4351 domain-containing protein [Chondromyces apiculatus]EYF03009.1 Hypothetical protein CAP_6272 [Chondromyces apiculatus DSM 436]
MHNRSDQFAKNILRDALNRASTAETEVEVLAATQKIDVYSVSDPAREAERREMGLLGELSAEPSLFEPYHATPSLRHVRHCLRKQLTWHHELERRARAARVSAGSQVDPEPPSQPPVPFPALVVISPGRPETVLEAYGCQRARPGLWQAVPGLAMCIVILAELPRTRDTLLLRLLGEGQLLHGALADLAALPEDAWENGVATPLLVHFRLSLVEAAANEEDEMSAEIRAWFQDYQQKLRDESRSEGQQEGCREGERLMLLKLLQSRFGDLPAAVVTRIEAAEMPELERWAERLPHAQTLAEVLDELS